MVAATASGQEPTSPNTLLQFRNGPICQVGLNDWSSVVPATRRRQKIGLSLNLAPRPTTAMSIEEV